MLGLRYSILSSSTTELKVSPPKITIIALLPPWSTKWALVETWRLFGACRCLVKDWYTLGTACPERERVDASVVDIILVQILLIYTVYPEARGSVDGWGTMLQTGRSQVPIPMRSLNFSVTKSFHLLHCPEVYSSSKRSGYQKTFVESRAWLVPDSDNFTALCESIV